MGVGGVVLENDFKDGGGICSMGGLLFLRVLCRSAMVSDWLDLSPGRCTHYSAHLSGGFLAAIRVQFSSLRVLLRDGAAVVRGRRSLLPISSINQTDQRGEGSGSQRALAIRWGFKVTALFIFWYTVP